MKIYKVILTYWSHIVGQYVTVEIEANGLFQILRCIRIELFNLKPITTRIELRSTWKDIVSEITVEENIFPKIKYFT